ncbi:MAG: hypothetical protein Q7S87_09070 [Agitococcus sp.]|nr:hypothetical protein [Agitococcus sp.]MDO9177052.1 hypothetical protein [Agitococcus sp.]
MDMSIRNQAITKTNACYLQEHCAQLLENRDASQINRYRHFLAAVTNGRYVHQVIRSSPLVTNMSELDEAEEDAGALLNHNAALISKFSALQSMGTIVDKPLGLAQNTYRLMLDLDEAGMPELIEAVALVQILAATLHQYERPAPISVAPYLAMFMHKPVHLAVKTGQ